MSYYFIPSPFGASLSSPYIQSGPYTTFGAPHHNPFVSHHRQQRQPQQRPRHTVEVLPSYYHQEGPVHPFFPFFNAGSQQHPTGHQIRVTRGSGNDNSCKDESQCAKQRFPTAKSKILKHRALASCEKVDGKDTTEVQPSSSSTGSSSTGTTQILIPDRVSTPDDKKDSPSPSSSPATQNEKSEKNNVPVKRNTGVMPYYYGGIPWFPGQFQGLPPFWPGFGNTFPFLHDYDYYADHDEQKEHDNEQQHDSNDEQQQQHDVHDPWYAFPFIQALEKVFHDNSDHSSHDDTTNDTINTTTDDKKKQEIKIHVETNQPIHTTPTTANDDNKNKDESNKPRCFTIKLRNLGDKPSLNTSFNYILKKAISDPEALRNEFKDYIVEYSNDWDNTNDTITNQSTTAGSIENKGDDKKIDEKVEEKADDATTTTTTTPVDSTNADTTTSITTSVPEPSSAPETNKQTVTTPSSVSTPSSTTDSSIITPEEPKADTTPPVAPIDNKVRVEESKTTESPAQSTATASTQIPVLTSTLSQTSLDNTLPTRDYSTLSIEEIENKLSRVEEKLGKLKRFRAIKPSAYNERKIEYLINKKRILKTALEKRFESLDEYIQC